MDEKQVADRLNALRDKVAPHITPDFLKELENLTIKEVRDFAAHGGDKAGPNQRAASIVTIFILTFAAR